MAIPNFQKFFLPVLRIAQDGETSLTNAINCIADEFKLTEKERELRVPSNTQTIINNRVSWARTYLIKAGLLKSTRRGYFTITDAGKEVLSTETSDIDINFWLCCEIVVIFIDTYNPKYKYAFSKILISKKAFLVR